MNDAKCMFLSNINAFETKKLTFEKNKSNKVNDRTVDELLTNEMREFLKAQIFLLSSKLVAMQLPKMQKEKVLKMKRSTVRLAVVCLPLVFVTSPFAILAKSLQCTAPLKQRIRK
uniref:Transmembrane protein n=1 Tax=Glossina brevipalpis TaxID=37001 RepID=A0A1A9WRG4_9MUSC